MCSLALWLGALMTGAISASLVFPSIHALDPRVPGFESFGGEHWKLVAGKAQQPIFGLTDLIQLGAGGLAFFTIGLRLVGAGVARAPRRAATLVRTLAVGVGVVLFTCNLMFLAPRMYPHLKSYWTLAAEGRTEEALVEEQAFNQMHPTASRLHAATSVCVLVAFVAGAWSLARRVEE